MSLKIISIVGARPQFIKASVMSRAIRKHNALYPNQTIEDIILHTGQHYDYEMSQVFFDELNLPKPTWNLKCTQIQTMVPAIVQTLKNEEPDYILVYGDTNSTLAGALAAEQMHLPLIHIEAGLRSFNSQMVEEYNRIETDRRSQLLFCPTLTAVNNLKKEGIQQGVYLVGDIMYDSVLHFSEPKREHVDPYYLLTIHRAEMVDNIDRIKQVLTTLSCISMPIKWPIHPRTKKVIEQNNELQTLLHNAKHIHILDSQGYITMLQLEREATCIITDSGGIQKEAFFQHVPCITLRDETEWPETIVAGWNILVGNRKQDLLSAINQPPIGKDSQAFGDGHTAEHILNILLNESANSHIM